MSDLTELSSQIDDVYEYTLKGHYITSGEVDLNDYVSGGVWAFSSSPTINNIPGGSNGYLLVLPCSASNAKQIWFRWGSSGNYYQTWIRNLNSGEWTDWVRIAIVGQDV